MYFNIFCWPTIMLLTYGCRNVTPCVWCHPCNIYSCCGCSIKIVIHEECNELVIIYFPISFSVAVSVLFQEIESKSKCLSPPSTQLWQYCFQICVSSPSYVISIHLLDILIPLFNMLSVAPNKICIQIYKSKQYEFALCSDRSH